MDIYYSGITAEIRENDSLQSIIFFSAFISVILVFVIPAISLISPKSNFVAFFTSICFLIAYLGFIYCTNYWLEGLSSVVLVTSIFSSDLPLINPLTYSVISGSSVAGRLVLYLVDPFLVLFILSLLYIHVRNKRRIQIDRFTLATVTGFLFFIAWSLISISYGDVESIQSSIIFTAENIRLFLLFIASMSVVIKYGEYAPIIPFCISVICNLIYSIGQVIIGGHFGPLSYLGEGGSVGLTQHNMGTVTLWFWDLQLGYYPGGFTGHAREFNALLLLVIPFVVYTMFNDNHDLLKPLIFVIFGILLHIFVSQSSTALISGIIVLIVSLLVCRHSSVLKRIVEDSTYYILLGFSAVLVVLISLTIATSSIISLLNNIGAVTPRLQVYSKAIRIYTENPLFGIGGYNFQHIYNEQIHNLILNHLVSVGIFGVVGYGSALVLIFWSFPQHSRMRNNISIYFACLFISMIGFHMYLFWTTGYSHPQANAGFWIVAGTAVGARLKLVIS